MKATLTKLAAGLAAAAFAGAAGAQTYGLATLPPGALQNALGSVIGKVVQDHGKMQMRVQGFGGDAGVLDAAASKGSDFFALDVTEAADAYLGRGNWNGKKRPTLRSAITMLSFQAAVFVRKDSPIQTLADLKGKRVPGVWAQQTGVLQMMTGTLAMAGLTYNDVQSYPVVNVVRAADDFKSGKLDIFFFAVGAPKVAEVAASVPGGVRAIPYETSPEAVKRMQQVRPEYYITEAKPAPHIAGVEKPLPVFTFDFIVGAGEHVPDEAVYQLVKALHTNKKDLAAGHPAFNAFNPDNAAKVQPTLPHHPGAIRYFKEIGAWKG